MFILKEELQSLYKTALDKRATTTTICKCNIHRHPPQAVTICNTHNHPPQAVTLLGQTALSLLPSLSTTPSLGAALI
jgi:hypothetical protein